MRRAPCERSVLTLLFLFALTLSAHAAAAAELRLEPGQFSAVVHLQRFNTFELVPVRINGGDTLWFVLDTGAAVNVVDSAVADRLKLPRAKIRGREVTASGSGVTGAAAGSGRELDDIAIGPARLGRAFVSAFDLKPVAASLGHEVPGLIGTQLLREFPFTLDYTADTLTLYDPAHFPPPELEHAASLPLRLLGNIPEVPGIVEGASGGWFCIDSGDNSEVALYFPFLRRHPELGLLDGRRAAGSSKSAGLSGAADFSNAWLEQFVVLGKTRMNVQVTFGRQPIEGAVSGDVYAGRVGGALLDGARLTMDYAIGRAWCQWPARRNATSANERDALGRTPLYRAAVTGDEKLVRDLLEHRANPNIAANDGRTPLSCACEAGNSAIASLLRKRGAAADAVAVCAAVRNGNPELLKRVVAARGPGLSNITQFDLPPLHWAALNDRPETIEAVLAAGADPARANGAGETALWLAAASGRAKAVAALLAARPSLLDQPSPDGTTPLMVAAAGGHAEVVEVLLKSGADVNRASSDGRTALARAADSGGPRVVRLLLSHGADPRIAANDGRTPFEIAAAVDADNASLLYGAAWRANPRPETLGEPWLRLPPGKQRVTLPLSRGGEYLFVRARVNGKEAGWFWLNTSIAGILIDSAAAEKLHLSTAHGSAPPELLKFEKSKLVSLATLSVGDVSTGPRLATCANLQGVSGKLSVPIAGVLGASFLRSLPFTLDWRAATLTVYDSRGFRPPDGPSYPLRMIGGAVPAVYGSIDDEADGWFALNSGDFAPLHIYASFLSLHPELERPPGRPQVHARICFHPGIARDEDTLFLRLGRFAVLGQALDPVNCTRSDMPDGGPAWQDQLAGSIGAAFLRRSRITVDCGAGRIWCERLPREPLDALLARLGDPKSADLAGVTPLMRASEEGRADAIAALRERGADVLAVSARGDCALRAASERGDLRCVRLLLGAGAAGCLPEDVLPLLNATASGNLEVVRALLAAGADPNGADDGGASPLHVAAQTDDARTAAELLDRGAKADALWSEDTPMTLAAAWGSTHALAVMLDHGATVNAAVKEGQTALIAAADGKQADVVRLLLAHGASPNLCDKQGRTALMCAAAAGDVGICRDLLAAGADPDARDKAGNLLNSSDLSIWELLQFRQTGAATRPATQPSGWTILKKWFRGT